MKNAAVKMTLALLDNIPEAPFPEGFETRGYKEGDRENWVEIYAAAEPFETITPELFDREFRSEHEELAKRMFFVTHNGQVVGTSTGWYDDKHKTNQGRVHWVAIHPDFQGRGLAKPLMSETLNRLQACGHTKAYLMTSTGRIPAITLYFKYGFVPDIEEEGQLNAWLELAPALRPEYETVTRELCREHAGKQV